MGQGRNWTKEEYDYLMDNWGKYSVGAICKHLNRSRNAINIKVFRLGLGAFLDAGEYITFNQLSVAFGRGPADKYMLTSWVKNRDFPMKYKTVGKNRFRVVYLKDFWTWAERHRTFIDFSHLEENMLGEEPQWVKEQRKADTKRAVKYHVTPWTTREDQLLSNYLKQYRFTYHDLSRMLGRTCGAIQRRICDLSLKERPLKADNHVKWTDTEKQEAIKMIQNGTPYSLIAECIGKSEKAIRGKVYIWFGTENLDKVIAKLKEEGAA